MNVALFTFIVLWICWAWFLFGFPHGTKRQIRRERANIPTIAARALKTGVFNFPEIAVELDEGGSWPRDPPQ